MKMETELRLASSHFGKVILHLGCMYRTGHLNPSWQGIVREFRKTLRGQPPI